MQNADIIAKTATSHREYAKSVAAISAASQRCALCVQPTVCGPKRANLGLGGLLGLDTGLLTHGSENNGV